MKAFELTWLDGRKEVVEGRNILDAFRQAGLSNAAVADLDSYKQIPRVIKDKQKHTNKEKIMVNKTCFQLFEDGLIDELPTNIKFKLHYEPLCIIVNAEDIISLKEMSMVVSNIEIEYSYIPYERGIALARQIKEIYSNYNTKKASEL